MKILILHNLYAQAGGEDAVVRHEAALLREAGNDVVVELVDNAASISSLADKVRTTVRIAYDPARRQWMSALLDRVRPEVVHVHNFFPLLTVAVHEAAHAKGVPVVQTLHNYRLGCAAATFERNGQICELCLSDHGRSAIRYRCYRGSRVGTAAIVYMQHRARKRNFLARNVDRFIALTQFARGKMIEAGLPAEKIAVKANFVDRPHRPDPSATRQGALFVGRLSAEKGVMDMIEAWRDLADVPLLVAGDGPAREAMEDLAPPNVRFLGMLDRSQVEACMLQARVLVMPSVWYEGFPVTLVEAFASALPVIATQIGSLGEIVVDGVNGYHCNVADPASLREVVRKFIADPAAGERMGSAARQSYEELYSKETNLQELMGIYREAIAHRLTQQA